MLEMLQATILEYNTTIEGIEEEEARLMTIMMTVMENNSIVDTLGDPLSNNTIGSIELLESEVSQAQNDVNAIQDRINTASMTVETQETNNTNN